MSGNCNIILSHFEIIRNYTDSFDAAEYALIVINFHWGLHALSIYAVTGLVMACFSFRKGYPNLVSAPLKAVFGDQTLTKSIGWLSDLLTIYAIHFLISGCLLSLASWSGFISRRNQMVIKLRVKRMIEKTKL